MPGILPLTQECQLNEINTDYSLGSTHSESLSSKTKIYHHPTNKKTTEALTACFTWDTVSHFEFVGLSFAI